MYQKLVGLFIFEQFLDFLSTMWGLHHHAYEANPVIRFLFPLLGAALAVAVFKLGLITTVLFKKRKFSFLYICTGFYGVLILWNGFIIAIASKQGM